VQPKPPSFKVVDVFVSPTLKVVRIEQGGDHWFQFLLLDKDDPRSGNRWRCPDPIE